MQAYDKSAIKQKNSYNAVTAIPEWSPIQVLTPQYCLTRFPVQCSNDYTGYQHAA